MRELVERAMPHLMLAPILLPLVTAAVLLFMGQSRRRLRDALLSLASAGLGLGVAVALLAWVDASPEPGALGVYLPSNWPVPFGIVLVLDRLSAMMLVLTSVLGVAAVLYSLAGWHRGGVHFHPLVQLQLMGLSGAFLTADLFNLFVFFEVMLAASYGLLLHGSGAARVRSGLHYIAVNLLASLFFLVGVAIIYGVSGTLNMADLVEKLALVPAVDRGLLHAGAAILAVAFLAKAAIWPLGFWLVPAYSAASAPVAGLFAIMTKVGLYAVLRLGTLVFPPEAGAMGPGGWFLVAAGLATMAFGAAGMLSSQKLARLGGFSIVLSAGTLLAAIGFGRPEVTGGALYYLLGSTLAASALFLLVELIERARLVRPKGPEPDDEELEELLAADEDTNLDDHEQALIGRVIPAAMAFLGIVFIGAALSLAGLPPMPGFVGKFAMLTALFGPDSATPGGWEWALLGALLTSGLATTVALSRAGIRHFWAPAERPPPHLRLVEGLPVAALLAVSAVLVVKAGPVLRFTNAAAEALHDRDGYVRAIHSARPVPNPPRAGGEAGR